MDDDVFLPTFRPIKRMDETLKIKLTISILKYLLFRSVPEAAGICRALQLAVKYRPVPQVSILLRSALSSDERIGVLASLLDQNIPLLVKSMPWPVSCS